MAALKFLALAVQVRVLVSQPLISYYMIILSIILLFLSVALALVLALSVAQRWAIQDLTEEVKRHIRNNQDDDEIECW